MARHTLSVYEVMTRVSYGDRTALGDIDGVNRVLLRDELIALFTDLAGTGQDMIDDEEREVTLAVSELLDDVADHEVAVIFETGDYGITSQFEELTTQEVVFNRRGHHVEVQPALVLFRLRPARQSGLMITHSPNGRGIKGDVTKAIREWVRERHEVTVLIETLTPGDAWRQLMDAGRLKEVTWIRKRRPEDFASELNERMWEEDVGTIEFVKKSPHGRAMTRQRIERFLEGQIEATDLLRVEEAPGVDFDNVKARVVLPDSRARTVNILQHSVPRLDYEITESLEWDDDGYPTLESLLRESRQLADSHEHGMGAT